MSWKEAHPDGTVVEHGSEEVGRCLLGRRVTSVNTAGGWLTLALDDGTFLLIAADYGASLSLEHTIRKTAE